MKLLSLNVALFEKNNPKLKQFIIDQNADIVCFQEVTKAISPHVDKEYISFDTINSSSLKLHYSFFAPTWILSQFEKVNFHGKKVFSFHLGGTTEFGQYCKSIHPIIEGQNIFVKNNFSYITDWSEWPKKDFRAVQVVDLQTPNSQLRILNYHGIWSKNKQGNNETRKACLKINQLAKEVTYPSIICGDFNLFPKTPSMQVFDRHQNLLNTYQIRSTRPESNELNHAERNVVDYILVSKNIHVKNFQVLQTDVSDHLPLILEFDI